MKIVILLIMAFSLPVSAQVNFKWIGISTFVISDQKTTVMFDPAITRAGIAYYLLPFLKIKTDESEVDYWMKRCGLTHVDGILVNHAHFDHAADASYMTKKYGGKLYGSSSVMKLGEGQGVPAAQRQVVKAGDEVSVGDFKIKFFSTPHAPHFAGIMFMDGPITQPLPIEAGVWDYKVGDALSFYITHPKGTMMFQAIGRVDENDSLKGVKADVLFMTIANRRTTEELVEKRIVSSGAKKIIPLHHDNFFFPMKRVGEIDILWGTNLEEFKEKTKKFNVIYPTYCQEHNLF